MRDSFKLKRPCKTCPFRREGGLPLRASRVRQLEAQVGSNGIHTHQCHQTYATHKGRSDFPICNGYINFAHKNGEASAPLRFAFGMGLVAEAALQSQDLVWDSWADMKKAGKNPASGAAPI